MAAKLEYRLLNKQEDQFIFETLAIIAVGIILILVFGAILHKAVTNSIQLEMPAGGNQPPYEGQRWDDGSQGLPQAPDFDHRSGAYVDLGASGSAEGSNPNAFGTHNRDNGGRPADGNLSEESDTVQDNIESLLEDMYDQDEASKGAARRRRQRGAV